MMSSNQRDGFRRYMEGLLLPSERHKMLTGLANTEPVVGAQLPRAQALQWFLSEADWGERKMQESRLQLLREDPTTAPTSNLPQITDLSVPERLPALSSLRLYNLPGSPTSLCWSGLTD
jgi:hypothetical protein